MAHANFPWIVTFDDHEEDKTGLGLISEDPPEATRKGFLRTEDLSPFKAMMNICHFAEHLYQRKPHSNHCRHLLGN